MKAGRALGVAIGLVAVAAAVPAHAARATTVELALRYAGQGWADLVQTAAATLAEGAVVDVDGDPDTVNSSRATLTVPPGSSVDWAGLYWGGSLAEGVGCAPVAGAPTPSPGRVLFAVGAAGYVTIQASSVSDVASPAYQAYANITSLLRAQPRGAHELTVADLPVAAGPGCRGAWTVLVAYSYPDGPQKTYAPTYRAIRVFDGIVDVPDIVQIGLPGAGAGSARLAASVLGGGSLAVAGTLIDLAGADPGYRTARRTVNAGDAAVSLPTPGYAGLVLGLAVEQKVDLSVAVEVSPPSSEVGTSAVITVTVRNSAPTPASGVVVVAKLPAALSLMQPADGYNRDTGKWSVGDVAGGGSRTLTLPVRVTSAGTFTWRAEVTRSAIRDVDSKPGDHRAKQDDLVSASLVGVPARTVALPTATFGAVFANPVSLASWRAVPAGAYFGVSLFAVGLLVLLLVRVRSQ